MTTIATICARGGSAGVPGKNIKPLLGKPLIAYTIEQAKGCARIDRLFVSTDDEAIAHVARECGAEVPFLRPVKLATSTAPKVAAIRHLVDYVKSSGVEVDRIVDLDPTSPLRDVADIDSCIDLLDDSCDVVITGYLADKNPYFNMVEMRNDGTVGLVKPLEGVVSRQQAPIVYAMNASIYVWRESTLSKGLWDGRTKIHVMPHSRSVDIDEPIDFKFVEMLMREKLGDAVSTGVKL